MDQKNVERIYGRKIVRDGQGVRHTKKNYARRFFMIMGCSFFLGAMFGSIVTGIIVHKNDMKKLMLRQETLSGAEVQMIQSSPYGSGNNVITDEGITWETDNNFIPLDVNMDRDLQEYVFELSAAYNIDWTLVMAIISHESEFVSTAISATNDYGLMQKMSATMKRFRTDLESQTSWMKNKISGQDFMFYHTFSRNMMETHMKS